MKLVEQQGERDSAAACLAMVLGMQRSSDVYPALGYNPNELTGEGVCALEIGAVLQKYGRKHWQIAPRETMARMLHCPEAYLKPRVCVPTQLELLHKLGGMQTGCAIVIVPSLDELLDEHYIVCRRGEIYDPSLGRKYTGTAQSLPVTFVVFIED